MEDQWIEEEIPDTNWVYRRVHRNHIYEDELQAGAFPSKDLGSGWSTDWERYSTPEDTRKRKDNWQNYAVIRLQVGGLRNLTKDIHLMVRHTPNQAENNRAHTDVWDEQVTKERITEIRLKLKRMSQWSIK